MTEKRYSFSLTYKQIYALRECFEASFTEPESMNDIEKKLSRRLTQLSLRAWKENKAGVK